MVLYVYLQKKSKIKTMDFNKQISFRPSPEMAETLSALFEKCENKDISITNFLNQIVCENLKPVEMSDNSEYVERICSLEAQVDEHKNEITEKDHAIHELAEISNENARIAQQLQLENEQLKTKTGDENKMFSDETNFKLWCILQLYKQQNPETTFEKMIVSIVNVFQKNGYLKLNTDDMKYIETIEHNYNGIIE